MVLAQNRLDAIAEASAVITTRLHAALPAAALGVPVLLIVFSSGLARRFSGYEDVVPHVSGKDARAGNWGYDLDNLPLADIPANLIDDLRDKCRKFVGVH